MNSQYNKRRNDLVDEVATVGLLNAVEMGGLTQSLAYDKQNKRKTTSTNTKYLILSIFLFFTSAFLISLNFESMRDASVFKQVVLGYYVDETDVVVDPNSPDHEGRDFVRKMMKHAWDSYVKYAWGQDELKPLEKNGANWGAHPMAVTILDSLDSLYIMNMNKEFAKAEDFVKDHLSFDHDMEVSHFETTIRCLGGLISAFELTGKSVFLEQATQLGNRLLPAFKTRTGVPNSFVNLKTGESRTLSWSNGAVLADFGSVQMEFNRLSHLTGNWIYYETAMSALRKALKVPNPDHGLYPKTFDNINGEWSAGSDYTLGALADSFYEYLLKIWALDGQMKPEFYNHWKTSEHAILKHLLKVENGHTFLASGHLEHLSSSQEHLTCFAGGLFGLSAKYAEKEESVKLLDIAERLTETCYRTYEKQRIGLAAEETSMKTMRAVQTKYILRPEVVESLFYMWRLTHKRKYRVWGAKIALAIELNCRTESGYVGLKDVEDLSAGYVDKQESFFLSETLKYLYLLFSEDSLISLDEYIFSTEAHPFRPLVRM